MNERHSDIASAVPAPTFERDVAGARVYRTASGVPIVVRIKPGAPLVNVGVYVVGGVSEESADRAGLTRLMVRTSLKGTTSRSALQIAEEAEMLGGSVGSAAPGRAVRRDVDRG